MKLVPLAMHCLVTNQLMCIPMIDGTRDLIKHALQWLMVRTGQKITRVTADHGTVFQHISEILPGVKLSTLPPRSQSRNRVERSMGVLSVWRRIVRKCHNEPSRAVYSYNTVQMLLDLACNVANSIPYNGQLSYLAISPDYFRRPNIYCLLDSDQLEGNDRELSQAFAKRIQEFFAECVKIRNQSLLDEDRKFRNVSFKGVAQAEVGDIVLVKDGQQYETARLAIIETLRNQTAVIRFCTGRRAEWGVGSLRPLLMMRNNFAMGAKAMNEMETCKVNKSGTSKVSAVTQSSWNMAGPVNAPSRPVIGQKGKTAPL